MRDTVCETKTEWEAELQRLSELTNEIGGYQGKLLESADTLAKVMALYDESGSWLQLLHVFAGDDEDMNRRLMAVLEERRDKTEFIKSEIAEIGHKQIKKFMAENKSLKPLKSYFAEIFRRQKLQAKVIQKK